MLESTKSESTKSEGSPKALVLAATLFALAGCGEDEKMKAELGAPFTDEELDRVCEEKGTRGEDFCLKVKLDYGDWGRRLVERTECRAYGKEIRKKCLTALQGEQTSGSLNCDSLRELCHRRVGKIQASQRTQLTPSYMLSQCETGRSTPIKRGK